MAMKRSRREFITQASVIVTASGVFLRNAWGAQARFVVADTALGKIRGVDADGIKTFKGIPYGASTAGQNRFMPPVSPAEVDRRARRAGVRTERAADASRA